MDGLRAVAVCAVLAFHADIPGISGGFSGVDVFFVISGYLITSLLHKEWASTGSISLAHFWARRVRRLAPALLLVLLAVAVASVVLLQRLSGETGNAARAMLWTLGVNANHYFLAQDGDYFAPVSSTNPLLHMWSLAVEEQFYLLWPLALFFVLRRRGLPGATSLAAAVIAVSLALSCWWTANSPAVAFYLMPSRAWELMLGALVAFAVARGQAPQTRAAAEGAAWTGLLMLAAGLVLLAEGSWFPGPAALLPVAGTALLIFAGASASSPLVSRVLGAPPVVYIGKISYPLYLWHWPALVLWRSTRLYEESLVLDLAALALSFVLAAATYELLEKPVWRLVRGVPVRRILVVGLAANFAVFCLAAGVGAWARFGWWYSPQELALDAARKDLPNRECVFGNGFPSATALDRCYPPGQAATVLLWGDSHANHWRPAIDRAAAQAGVRSAALTMNACRPLPGPVGRDDCIAFNERVLRELPAWQRERGLRGLVIAARWPEGTGTLAPSLITRAGWKPDQFYDRRAKSQAQSLAYFEQELAHLFETARAYDLRVAVVLPTPVQKFMATHCLSMRPAAQCAVPVADLDAYMAPAETVMRKVAQSYDNVRLVEPRAFMCTRAACPIMVDGTVAYTDEHHLTQTFVVQQANEFVPALKWITSTQGAESPSRSQ